MPGRLVIKAKKSKYRAQPTTVNGIRFASKQEAKRWGELKLMESQDGAITELRRQRRFKIFVNDVLITTYVSDFDYIEDGRWIVEDKKGFKTEAYKIKKKLMLAVHGIILRET